MNNQVIRKENEGNWQYDYPSQRSKPEFLSNSQLQALNCLESCSQTTQPNNDIGYIRPSSSTRQLCSFWKIRNGFINPKRKGFPFYTNEFSLHPPQYQFYMVGGTLPNKHCTTLDTSPQNSSQNQFCILFLFSPTMIYDDVQNEIATSLLTPHIPKQDSPVPQQSPHKKTINKPF